MKCLRCGTVEMEVHSRDTGSDTFEVDICSACGGLWLDAKELNRLDDNFFVDVEELDLEEVEPSHKDAGLKCPRCEEQPLLSKVRSRINKDVVLDTCPSCKGFWLDSGELEKVKEISNRMLIASLFD